jgi:uncharacterized membrane-anchored protein YitT (DUF2179 family)
VRVSSKLGAQVLAQHCHKRKKIDPSMLEMFLDFVILIIKHPVFSGIFCGRVDKLKSRHFKKKPGTSTKISTNG